MKKLAVIGASGHGKVVAETAEIAGWDLVVFFDDAYPEKTELGKWIIEGNTQDLLERPDDFSGLHVAIGDNQIRSKKLHQLEHLNIVSIIHPRAIISPSSVIGEGAAVFAGVVINADAQIGFGSIINTACTIDHDCRVGDFTHISPGVHLAGQVTIGDRSWIGIGTTVIQCINIGSDVIIGAGSAVINDIPSFSTAVGVPSKVIKPL